MRLSESAPRYRERNPLGAAGTAWVRSAGALPVTPRRRGPNGSEKRCVAASGRRISLWSSAAPKRSAAFRPRNELRGRVGDAGGEAERSERAVPDGAGGRGCGGCRAGACVCVCVVCAYMWMCACGCVCRVPPSSHPTPGEGRDGGEGGSDGSPRSGSPSRSSNVREVINNQLGGSMKLIYRRAGAAEPHGARPPASPP